MMTALLFACFYCLLFVLRDIDLYKYEVRLL